MKPADTSLEIFIKEWLARWEDLRAAQIEQTVRETVRVHAGSIDRGINVRCSGCDKTVGTWAAFADHIAAIVSERIAQ